MNNQEAIEHIKTIQIYSYQDGYTDEAREALDMAISALKAQDLQPNLQSTCNLATDTISRQDAIDAILAVTGNSSVRELYEHVQEHGLSDMWSGGVNAAIDIIIAVPPAHPEQDENDLDFVQPHKRIPVQLVVSSDCISREDAIECLERLSACAEPFVEIGTDDETFIGRYEAITEISDLPPAQPYTEAEIQKMQDLYQAEIDKAFELGQEDARSEIIHCGDCKYYHASDGCFFSTATTGANGFCHWAERKEGEADEQVRRDRARG